MFLDAKTTCFISVGQGKLDTRILSLIVDTLFLQYKLTNCMKSLQITCAPMEYNEMKNTEV